MRVRGEGAILNAGGGFIDAVAIIAPHNDDVMNLETLSADHLDSALRIRAVKPAAKVKRLA